MTEALLVGNGRVLTLGTECLVIEKGAVLIENGLISRVGFSEDLQADAPETPFIDCNGSLIMPGFTCIHTHTYGAFARGMGLKDEAPANFPQVLKRLWWRLDRSLSSEDIYYSALVTFIDCLKNGTTTLLDHHASSTAIGGSLEKIAQAANLAGIRAGLCYEVSDRDGKDVMFEGLAENAAFIKKCREQPSPFLAATFGMHASFTISSPTMEKCAKVIHDLESGLHIHVAESREDAAHCREKYKMGIVERLNTYGLLGNKTVAAHCVHIDSREMALLAASGSAVAHNPQSNMNNAVGCAPVQEMLDHGVWVGMGTDGMTCDMLEGIKTAHIIHKHCQGDPRAGWEAVPRMQFNNNSAILAEHFSLKTGELTAGAAGDLIVVDYQPPTPLTGNNYYGHLVFGVSGRAVETTIIGGRVLMENRRLLNIDEQEVKARARELAARLWKRF